MYEWEKRAQSLKAARVSYIGKENVHGIKMGEHFKCDKETFTTVIG